MKKKCAFFTEKFPQLKIFDLLCSPKTKNIEY